MTRSRELAELASVYDSGNSLGFRNRIINGDMRIDQRNAGASTIPSGNPSYQSCDRWASWVSALNKFSLQQNAGAVTPPAGFSNYLGATSLAATSLGLTDIYAISQQIEGYNIADLGWGTASAQAVTLSFWVRSSLTGTFGGAINNNGSARSYPFSFTISAANTWEQKTLTIAGDTSGTWLTTNGIGMYVVFSLGCGATRSGTAGAWNSNWNFSATGATSVVGTNGATFYITGVQLEAGTVASPFERRDYGRELMMCQRYYSVGKSGFAARGGDNYYEGWVQLKEDMRATATIATSPGTWTIAGQRYDCFRAGKPGVSGGSEDFTYTASAEL